MNIRTFLIFACVLFIISNNALPNSLTVTNGTDATPAPAGSLRDAVNNAQDGDTINIANNIDTIYLTSQITITKSVSIVGHPNLVINITTCDTTWYRMFEITGNKFNLC